MPPPMSFILVSSPKEYLVKSTEHEAVLYVVLFTPIVTLPLRPEYLSQHPILEHRQLIYLSN